MILDKEPYVINDGVVDECAFSASTIDDFLGQVCTRIRTYGGRGGVFAYSWTGYNIYTMVACVINGHILGFALPAGGGSTLVMFNQPYGGSVTVSYNN